MIAPRPAGTERRGWASSWWLPVAVLAVAFVVHANTLGYSFTWDDHALILLNPHVDDWGYLMAHLADPVGRPLQRASLLIDDQLWGEDYPAGFHLTSILLDALASVLLYRFVARLSGSRRLGAIAGLVFAVHPVHVETVANVSHRKESLSLVFLLIGLLAYIEARAPRWRLPLARAGLLALTLVAYLAGVLSKEVGAVMLPALVLVYELGFVAGTRDERRRAILRCLALALPVVLLLWYRGDLAAIRVNLRPDEIRDWFPDRENASYGRLLLGSLQAFGVGLGLLFWPWPLYLDRAFPMPASLLDRPVVVGLGLLIFYAVALVRSWSRSRIAFFALAWYGLTWLPVSNLLPLSRWWVAERFLYVPSAGFAILIALWIDSLAAERPRVAALALAALLSVHGVLTIRQDRVWTNETTLWSHTLRYNPDSWHAQYGFGIQRYRAGDYAAAETSLRRAIAVGPDYWDAYYALAMVDLELKRWDEAVDSAERYAALQPGDANAYAVIGSARLAQGRLDDAIAAYRRQVELDPAGADGQRGLAIALEQAGCDQEALGVIDAALGDDRPDAALLELRGRVLSHLGRRSEAMRSWRRALDLEPNWVWVINDLAWALVDEGRLVEAEVALQRSLALAPAQPQMRALLEEIRGR